MPEYTDYALEADFQEAIVQVACLHGWAVFHDNDPRRNRAGFPDLCMARNGHVIFAELKVGYNKPTQDQEYWLEELGTAQPQPTHLVRCWYPRDWDEIVSLLTAEPNRPFA